MTETFIYYGAKMRHRVRRYPGDSRIFASLQKRILFIWFNVDIRRYVVRTDGIGRRWWFEWIEANPKSKLGSTIAEHHFRIEDRLKEIFHEKYGTTQS